MMLPEDMEYVDDHPEWTGLSVTEELRVANERIAALEAELAAVKDSNAKLVARRVELKAELEPWRQMTRQLEALIEAGWMPIHWQWEYPGNWIAFRDDDDRTVSGRGSALFEAVAAAYEQVMGRSGTKIVKLIKLTERGKWHINERGFPVCGASLELDPIDEMEIERRIFHEHAGVCVVCKREFKGVGGE